MKNLLKSILLISTLALGLTVNVGCGKIGGKNVGSAADLHAATKDVEVQLVHAAWGSYREYKGTKKNINITQDFTIMTSDDFFTYNLGQNNNVGRILEKMTLNGNGHTITIKGESNGSFGRYNSGLFGRIQNCEIKDLNIVYDLDLNINGSDGSKFGGLAGDISGSKVTNCNVSYNRKNTIAFYTDRYGYHNSGYGGIVGYSGGTTYDNCTVNGKIYGTAGYIGGIAAYTYSDVVIKNTVFSGGLSTAYLEESFVGGIAGYNEGEIYSSKVNLDYFKLVGQPQAWRARTSSGGGLVGKLKGNLHDCYIDFENEGYYYAESINEGTFATSLNKGVIVGEAVKGSKVKNVYVDGMKDTKANISYAEAPQVVNLGIGKNESTEISNLFFVDDNYYYNYEESFTSAKEVQENNYAFSGTIHNETATVKVITKYDEEDAVYEPDYIIFTLGENTYNLTTKNPLAPNGEVEYWDSIDNYQYIINVKLDSNDTYKVTFNKNIKYVNIEGIQFVSSYDDIVFDLDEEVIGGNTNHWKYDSTTNKPLLKTID